MARRERTYLRPAQRDALLAGIDSPRDRAIVTLFAYAGIRLNELRLLDRGDIDFEGGTVTVRFAKRGKWRRLGLHERAELAIRAYLDTRADDDPALFLSRRRQRIARRTIQDLLDRYTPALGLTKRITPHSLRRTFATDLLRKTRNLPLVQRALGHSNISTTALYTQLEDNELYEAMRE